jgi:hypothetical protein
MSDEPDIIKGDVRARLGPPSAVEKHKVLT